ncbi:MAG: peptidoglycan DD-metalloendopeptidase family protein [Campylobacterota bacterium]
MIRLLFALILVVSFLNAKDDINKKISKTNSKMSSYSKNYSNINKKMAKTAKAILKQKKELEKQNKFLKKLKKELGVKESSYKENSTQLVQLRGYQNELKKEQNSIEEELVFVIAQSVSLSVILEEDHAVNAESLMEFEVLNKMLNASKERAKKLNKKFYSNSKNIDVLKGQTQRLEVAISNIDKKRKKLLKTKKANKKALKKLKLAKASYKKELKKLISKQNALKKTLAQLNIIKIDEAKKAKQEKERKAAFKRKSIVSNENLPKVKKHGSSYQAIKTKRYRGPKTIAPLDSYTMTKKYGTYTDPIYGIKIFNESISLKPRKANSKVKTVFNGKIIYADKTAVLDNIVIVEHKDGLHTIYANLSQISPNVKKGKKIKKGYTIGRVSEELVFEVTQKSYHINPIRLFQ